MKSISKKSEKYYYSIADAAVVCGVTTEKLRRWGSYFSFLNPVRLGGSRHYYQPKDIPRIKRLKAIICDEGLSLSKARLMMLEEMHGPNHPTLQRLREEQEQHASPARRERGRLYPLDSNYVLTVEKIVDICRCSRRQAQRFIASGKAPYLAFRLLDLHLRGRILPDSWNHCSINYRGKLEFFQVGEFSEDEVLNARWETNLHLQRVQVLERELEKSQQRVVQLEECLGEAMAGLGQIPAAND